MKLKKLTQIETQVDDMPGEWVGFLIERLFEEGALDAWVVPIVMKKSRPAFLIQVLSEKKNKRKLIHVLIKETTSLGVRCFDVERYELFREKRKFQSSLGEVEVKLGFDQQRRIVNISPEYESCKKIARLKKISLKEVYQRVLKDFRA